MQPFVLKPRFSSSEGCDAHRPGRAEAARAAGAAEPRVWRAARARAVARAPAGGRREPLGERAGCGQVPAVAGGR
eukprot:8315695-Pyramimonas_sp.AAC.1